MDNTIYKKKILHDFNKSKDVGKIITGSRVLIYSEGTDELLFDGANKVIISGSGFTAAKHFNIAPPVDLPTYNSVLGLDNSVVESHFPDEIVCLFAVGNGLENCGTEASQIKDVDYTKWILPESLVPFRYVLDSADLAPEMRSKYFGRKVITANNRIAYYFKAFESTPEIKMQRIDGTPIDNTIFTSTNTMEAQTFVELKLKVTKEDCREWFTARTSINDAQINTLSLLTAWKKIIDGNTYYQNIRPLTKLNISNEGLIDLTKGLDIIYQIYY
jgi:hypothetical protein